MFLGIDIHKREAQVAVRNDDGDVIEQVRVKNTDLEEIAQRYADGEALLEATTNYFYIHDMLSEYLDVSVGHPPKLKAIAQTDKKTDQIDAKELSRLLWLGSVPESYVPIDEIRECPHSCAVSTTMAKLDILISTYSSIATVPHPP
jgi:transposase